MSLQGLEREKGLYTRPLSGQCRQQAGRQTRSWRGPGPPTGPRGPQQGPGPRHFPVILTRRGLGKPSMAVACPEDLGDPQELAQGHVGSDWAASDTAWA